MKAIVRPSKISGNILAPTSKSSMQRACAAALLAKGRSVINHPGHANDDKAAMEIITKMGASLELTNEELIVNSDGLNPLTDEVNCGESGLSIRMFTPIIALASKQITITGEGSLISRPMDFFDEILPKLGVKVISNNGRLPIQVRGPLVPRDIEIDGSLSSQFLTGLLMAFGAATSGATTLEFSGVPRISITVRDLTSKPYIDLTLDVMKQFGLNVPGNKDYQEFIFEQAKPGVRVNSENVVRNYTVEGDWSGGAFLLVAGAIAGPINIRGLDMNSTQGDKVIMKALSAARASFAIEAKGIKVRPGEMIAFEFDATDSPDLFPPLVALASYCKGQTKLRGVSRLTHKESNRTASLQEEFGKMGVKIDVQDDHMIVNGGDQVKGAILHSHHDHRIAMACAIAALRADGESTIEEADAVKKSYPDFYDDLKKLGADVSLSTKIKFHE